MVKRLSKGIPAMSKLNLESIIQAAQGKGANGAALSSDERRAKVKELLAEGDRPAVDAVLNEAIEKFQDLNAVEDPTDEQLDGLQLIVDAMAVTREVQADHDAVTQQRLARRAELADQGSKLAAEAEPAGEGADAKKGAEATDAGDPAVVKGESTDDDKDDKAKGGDASAESSTDAGDGGAEAAAGAELVTASGNFSIGNIPSRSKKASVRTEQNEEKSTKGGLEIITAAGIRGNTQIEGGQALSGISELAAAATQRIKGLPVKGVRGAQAKADIASIKIQFPDDLVASAGNDDMAVMKNAVSYDRLPGGELTAAGWCSPSEVLFDIPGSLTDPNAGLLNLPEVQMERGGLRFRRQIDFGAIYSGGMAGRVMTETMADSEDPEDYTKTFYRLDCPEFVEVRADAVYTGATAGILQNHAYPEEVEGQISELVSAHAHKVNAITIARTEAYFQAQNAVNLTTFGPGALGGQLNAIEWMIVNERYRYRANESMKFKVALPIWDKSAIRFDYSLRNGVDNPFDVTDEMITGWFSKRGASVDWVHDWQDALTGGGATVGATATPTVLPTTVKALVYPEGTILRGRGDIINLEAVYDSVGLTTNEFLRLFMEESLAVVWRAYRGSVVTLNTMANGATGAAVPLDAQGKIVPAV